MTDKAKEFLNEAQSDPGLKDKFLLLAKQVSADKSDAEAQAWAVQKILPIAKEHGYDLAEEDFKLDKDELPDEELRAVAGGGYGGCFCPLVGGGGGESFDRNTFGCACVGYGQGGDAKEDHTICVCIAGGIGDWDRQVG